MYEYKQGVRAGEPALTFIYPIYLPENKSVKRGAQNGKKYCFPCLGFS